MQQSFDHTQQITTITFFRFEGRHAFWMFGQMQLALPEFRKVDGLKFFKLMGSGAKNGFSRMININVYALIGVWESEEKASLYFGKSAHFSMFSSRSSEIWTVYMRNAKAHGLWSGTNPFGDFTPYEGGPIAVITRATIKLRHLQRFWKRVPAVSAGLEDRNAAVFSIGIGEYPWIMQATFSIWQDQVSMQDYAYRSKLHQEVIRQTREWGWYKEELFANFIPYKSTGSWNGENPLLKLLRQEG